MGSCWMGVEPNCSQQLDSRTCMGLQELTKSRGSCGSINFLVNHAGHLVITTLAVLPMTRLALSCDSSPTEPVDTGPWRWAAAGGTLPGFCHQGVRNQHSGAQVTSGSLPHRQHGALGDHGPSPCSLGPTLQRSLSVTCSFMPPRVTAG